MNNEAEDLSGSQAALESESFAGAEISSQVKDEKLYDFKKTLNEEGLIEEKGGVVSFVAKDFMEKLKTGGKKTRLSLHIP